MRRARPGHGALARWRAWLHRPAGDPASDEQEEKTAPPSQDPDRITRSSPQASLDEVLREAAQKRVPRNGLAGGQGSPTAT
jgi:hypothetical protein